LSASALAAKPEGSAASKEDAAAALDHYNRGRRLYDLNRFDEAIKEFEAAYEISDKPILLYNIAQSYRLGGRYTEAIRFYRTYLRKIPQNKPPTPDLISRPDVEQKIADCEKMLAEHPGASTSPSGTTAPSGTAGAAGTAAGAGGRPAGGTEAGAAGAAPGDEPPAGAAAGSTDGGKPAVTQMEEKKARPSAPLSSGKKKLIIGIVVAAVGVAAVGAGIAFGLMAQDAADKQAKNATFDPSLDSTGKSDQTLGLVLDIVGGAAIAAGVGVAVWGAMAKPENARAARAPHLQVLPALGHSYAGGSVRLDF
jgi:tetratricopeptide (TPR) repeat protein